MDANVLIQGLLGGSIFALAGWGISKIGGRSKEKTISQIQIGFSAENLSIKEKTAIIFLFMKIAECDGSLNVKEYKTTQAIMSVLGYKPDNKETEAIGVEMEKYSIDELAESLQNIAPSQKEWFVRTAIILIESDRESSKQEIDFALHIFHLMGIIGKTYSEIKNQVTNKNQ